MRIVVLSFLSLNVFAVAACGAELSEADARQLWRSVEDSLVDGSGHGSGGFGQALTVAASVDSTFDAACDDGGEVAFDGRLDTVTDIGDGAGVSTATVFDYDATYDDCADDGDVLNGIVEWSNVVNANVGGGVGAEVVVVYSYEGTVAVSGETNGTCDFDIDGSVVVSAGDSGVFVGVSHADRTSYQGTLCGYDAEDTLDVDVVVSVDDE